MKAYFSVTKKVALGYLVIVFFGALAIGYALNSLHENTRNTEQLVNTQFRATTLLRDIRNNLIGQENLEKQLVILQDNQLLDLLQHRYDDLDLLIVKLYATSLSDHFVAIPMALQRYRQLSQPRLESFTQKDWLAARQLSHQATAQRKQLLDQVAKVRSLHQIVFDQNLQALSAQANRAFRLTLILALIGIILSAPVALTVVISIHRSVRALQEGTRNIAQGNFDSQLTIHSNDEFGRLALDFSIMARKLSELEQLHLDANPLTRLPGNLSIDREIEERIQQHRPFAHLYIDLDNFKVYGDRYGYKAGSNVIHHVGLLLQQVVEQHGNGSDLVGHIGGDDYVVITDPDRAEAIAQALIDEFEHYVPELYSEEDLQSGVYSGTDRYGTERTFPLLTMSIAIILSENIENPTILSIGTYCAKMKEHLKRLKGNNYLIDRRKYPT